MIEDIVGAATEGERNQRFAGFHHDQGRHDRAQVGTSIFFWRVDTPEAHLLGLHLQRVIEFWLNAVWVFTFVLQHLVFEGHQFTLNKTPYSLLDHFLFFGEGEIHSNPFRGSDSLYTLSEDFQYINCNTGDSNFDSNWGI